MCDVLLTKICEPNSTWGRFSTVKKIGLTELTNFFAYLQHPMSQKQDVVVVLCGGNNICNLSVSPDTIAAELFGRFCGSGSVVVFCSIIPRREGGGKVPVGFEARAKQFNTVLHKLTAVIDHCLFCELDRRLVRYIDDDQVHLKDEGQVRLFHSLSKAVDSALHKLQDKAITPHP